MAGYQRQDSSKHPHGAKGRFAYTGGRHRRSSAEDVAAELERRAARTADPAAAEKLRSAAAKLRAGPGTGVAGGEPGSPAAESKFVGKKVTKVDKERADANEKEVARAMGGRWQDDDEPVDVEAGRTRAVEVKSILKGQKQAVTMHPDALLRKVEYQSATGRRVDLVAVDDRKDYAAGGEQDYSGNKYYYKRGCGAYTLAEMHPCESLTECKRLAELPESRLPEKARGEMPKGRALTKLRAQAQAAHAARLIKDRAYKARLKAVRAAA